MYLTLLVVVILTAIALVAVALGIANAISPRSFNPQKGEAANVVFLPVENHGCSSKWVITYLLSCF